MRRKTAALGVVLLTLSILFDPPNANTAVPVVVAAIAAVKEIVGLANELNTMFNGKRDLDSVKSDLGQIKAKLDEMNQKLDEIAKAIDALPGFIREQFNEEARRHLFSVLRTRSVQFDEWAADPKANVHEINAAVAELHEASDNLMFRADKTPFTIYADYNLIALAMATEYKLLLLTERKTPSTTHFQIYADFFREATNPKTSGSLAQYKLQLESEIADAEKRAAGLTKPICCISNPNAMQAPNPVSGEHNCGYDLGQKVLGDLKTGYTDNGGQVYCQILTLPPSCKKAKVMYNSTPAYNDSSRGCASNLNAERDAYFAKQDADKVTIAALNSALRFRKWADKLAGR